MDDDTIKKFFASTAEHILVLEHNIAELRAAIGGLKVFAASQMSPDDPSAALKQFQEIEQKLLASDPSAPARQQAADIVEAVKLWKEHGGGRHHQS